MKRIEDSLTDLWDNIKCTNIQIIEVPEEEEKKKGTKKIFEEIVVEKFPNMGKEIGNQGQEAQRVPNRLNPRRNTPRHILIKLDYSPTSCTEINSRWITDLNVRPETIRILEKTQAINGLVSVLTVFIYFLICLRHGKQKQT